MNIIREPFAGRIAHQQFLDVTLSPTIIAEGKSSETFANWFCITRQEHRSPALDFNFDSELNISYYVFYVEDMTIKQPRGDY